ncbi:hypothetical protein EON83_17075 [bacterium]|nr:MAG: hypothetical protein EON83_17075 [bacterium]
MTKSTSSASPLLFMAALALGSFQTQSQAYEPRHGEWIVVFGGIQKTEQVKVTVKANGQTYSVTGRADKVGVIFKALSGKFQPTQKYVNGKPDHFVLLEPVEVTLRNNGKQFQQIRANRADIQYEKLR